MSATLFEPLWPAEKIEDAYSFAYEFYRQGFYKEARELFSFLTIADMGSLRHWMGLGATLQMEKNHEGALRAYSLAIILEESETDPFPHVHAAECLYSLERVEEALQLLDNAEKIAAKDSKYKKLSIQITLLKMTWRKHA